MISNFLVGTNDTVGPNLKEHAADISQPNKCLPHKYLTTEEHFHSDSIVIYINFHYNTDSPTIVTCEIFIRSIGSINPESMDYEVDLYLRQSWYDERLKTVNGSRALDLNDPKLVQMIWKPEVFFANAKTAEFQYVTVPNVLVRLETGGKILYMLR